MIAFNFATLKKGGGQTVALRFLNELENQFLLNSFVYVVAKGSSISEFLRCRGIKSVFEISKNPVLRVLQEILIISVWLRIKKVRLVYSYFGFGLYFFGPKQIVGSADSNLYFPEVDFWQGETTLGRLKRYLVDKFRIFGVKKAHVVVYENMAMLERAKEIYSVKRPVFIAPSIEKNIGYNTRIPSKNNVVALALCGWQRNKNILLFPEIIHKAKEFGLNLCINFSVEPDGSKISDEFLKLAREFKVLDAIRFIGSISKSEIASVYEASDVVFLLSKLESFSNNIIEAWSFGKPLIVADEPWSRSICKDAAVYVDREDSTDIVKKIINVSVKENYRNYVDRGVEILDEYPTPTERIDLELSMLSEILDEIVSGS